jgi:hypothetical protein
MAANYIGTAFDSGRLNGGFSKSYNSISYMDLGRYSNFKRVNIDYTLASNSQPLTLAPVFNANKITRGSNNLAYLDYSVDFVPDSLTNTPINKEFNKIR